MRSVGTIELDNRHKVGGIKNILQEVIELAKIGKMQLVLSKT
jgi:hypothetical protein